MVLTLPALCGVVCGIEGLTARGGARDITQPLLDNIQLPAPVQSSTLTYRFRVSLRSIVELPSGEESVRASDERDEFFWVQRRAGDLVDLSVGVIDKANEDKWK